MAEKWMQKESQRQKHAGTEGSLTRTAHRAGYSTATAYARHVKAHPEGVSGKTKKRANLALVYAKHRKGG
jgi:hypothetical protein